MDAGCAGLRRAGGSGRPGVEGDASGPVAPPGACVGFAPLGVPRTILYTGKGGVGKTSVAAAPARRCAAAGLRTVVLSTDPAHSLSDSLEAPLGAEPTHVGTNLFGKEVQAQEEMERHWDAVGSWLGD